MRLRGLVGRHEEFTDSQVAHDLLDRWEEAVEQFWRIAPKANVARLEEEHEGTVTAPRVSSQTARRWARRRALAWHRRRLVLRRAARGEREAELGSWYGESFIARRCAPARAPGAAGRCARLRARDLRRAARGDTPRGRCPRRP